MSALMGFSVEMIMGMPVVTAPSEIDISSTGMLDAAIHSAAAYGYATLVIDMSRTTYCDTAGIRVLVRGHQRAVAEGGELRLVIRTAALLRLFAVSGADQLFPVFTSLTEAVGELPAIAIRPQQPSPRVRVRIPARAAS